MRITRISKALILCALSIVVAACAPRTKTITIIAVNDIHGQIDNFPRLATLVGRYRAADSLRVVLVDAGDRWTGNPFVDRNPERGKPVVDLQNELGFDVSTLGNHGFDFGLDVLRDRVNGARFRITSANIDSNGSALPQPEPYVMMEADGVKLCFIGLINTSRAGYPDGFVENFGSIRFSNPITAALAHRGLRSECDVMIGLTHLGAEIDTLLARQMPELDLIIGGHSHTAIPEGFRVGDVLVTQAGSRLKYADVITVEMRRGKVAGIRSRLVGLDTIAPDPKFAALTDSFYDLPELSRVQGELLAPLNRTGILNMTTDIIRQSTRSDLAIYNRGGVRADTLKTGPLTAADFYAVEPFGNMVSVIKLTEERLRELILRKAGSMNMEPGREDIVPSGFTYTLHGKSDGSVDVTLKIDARPGPDGTFSVATSDYLDKTYDFPGAGTGESTGVVVSHMLMRYFEKHHTFSGDNTPRTSTEIVPKE
jgi:5'-nucleotidase